MQVNCNGCPDGTFLKRLFIGPVRMAVGHPSKRVYLWWFVCGDFYIDNWKGSGRAVNRLLLFKQRPVWSLENSGCLRAGWQRWKIQSTGCNLKGPWVEKQWDIWRYSTFTHVQYLESTLSLTYIEKYYIIYFMKTLGERLLRCVNISGPEWLDSLIKLHYLDNTTVVIVVSCYWRYQF